MKQSIRLLFCLSVWTFPCLSWAQLADPINSYIHEVRIGLVDEFFARFNGAKTHPDFPITKDDFRKNNLMMLFDLAQFSSKDDSKYKAASEMMNVVIEKGVQLYYADTTWTALAHCKGKLDGNLVDFDLYLTVEHRKEDMYKWVISGVDGKLFDVTPKNMAELIMLYPDDHETSFMSLQRMTTEQPQNVVRFLRRNFKYDAMSAFTYMIYSKRLSIEYVEHLEFVFTQVPGYIFNVCYFNRETLNAGWLIESFRKVSDAEKNAFLHNLWYKCNNKSSQTDSVTIRECTIENSKTNFRQKEITDSLKDLTQRRTFEKIGQLKDYISLMQSKDRSKEENHELLSEKLANLFAEDVIIKVVDENGNITSLMDIRQLCTQIRPKGKVVCIKALAIPVWDDTLSVLDESVKSINIPAVMYNIETGKKEETSLNAEGRTLPIRREETVDGIEWIPLLGDMIVTFEKNK